MSQVEIPSPLLVPEHSKAFERLVQEPDDIVGLLAYALYKRTINERKAAGHGVLSPKDRDPQGHEISLHRNQAEDYLRTFAQTAIEGEKSTIWIENVKTFSEDVLFGVGEAKKDIEAALKKGTGFWWPGVAIGVVAWFASLFITLIIYANTPDWLKGVASHIPAPPS